jgi:hypothetical protein
VTWTFGEPALPQTEAAAAAVRRAVGLLLALERDEPAAERLVAELTRAADALETRVPADSTPRVGAAVDRDGRVYLDHSRDIGAFNPCFPEYGLEVAGDRASGVVAFPLPYEGPPGVVHGGFLSLFFDCVVQHHNCDLGVAGKTTGLSIRFRRPTPILVPLAFTIERVATDDRIRSTGRLTLDDRPLCEAEVEAIAGDRADLPAVSPRRTTR